MKTKLRLEITTTHDRRLTPAETTQAKHGLTSAANHLAGEGLLTGNGTELDSWESRVIEVKPVKRNESQRKRARP